jgi:glycogen debranching enzyme
VACTLVLRPREKRRICIVVAPVVDGEAHEPLFACSAFDAPDSSQPEWVQSATRLHTSNAVVQRAWDRAVIDFASLGLGDGESPAMAATPAAGVPLYGTLFGRDALTASGQALLASPEVAEGALRVLARHIGTKDDDFFDEQPGRVPQQVRDGPLARLRITPWLHDYGDYAAPCAFLVLLGAYHMVTGDLALVRELREPAERVLGWLEHRADIDGDGFLEYRTRSPKGQKHQGWKDAGNAVVDADGQQVDPPIAACEIQGYWYAAKLMMAELFLALGDPSRAFDEYRQAQDLKHRFNERFWLPRERFIAFGLDGDKRQIASIASNAAHCLATGIVDGAYARDVVARLVAPDMFSGWGIRTLSADNPAYNPFKYHLGTVWPVENATAALGMKRYGFGAEASRLAGAMFDASTLFEHARLPETFGGLPRDAHHPHPGIYPDACAPQAWSATAVFWFVQAMLGVWTYAPLNALIIEPELPEWLPELTLRNLRVKDARVSIQFKRDRHGNTDYRVLGRSGTVRVLRQPAPEDVHAGPVTRVRELVESLLPGH